MRGLPFKKGHKTNLGRKHTQATKRKLSEAHKGMGVGRRLSEEHKRKIALGHTGKARLVVFVGSVAVNFEPIILNLSPIAQS